MAFESHASTLLGLDAAGQTEPAAVHPDGILDLGETNFVAGRVRARPRHRPHRTGQCQPPAAPRAAWTATSASISGDGQLRGVRVLAPNLVPGELTPVSEVFLHDLRRTATTRVSLGTSDDRQGNEDERAARDSRGRHPGGFISESRQPRARRPQPPGRRLRPPVCASPVAGRCHGADPATQLLAADPDRGGAAGVDLEVVTGRPGGRQFVPVRRCQPTVLGRCAR